ncbi:MAG: hypothetical protein AAGM22_17485 [Acidobacteriota bacterium]
MTNAASDPSLELLAAQVDVALEEGDVQAARTMLDQAVAHFGDRPAIQRLRAQVEEVARLTAGPSPVDGLVQEAQERVRTADYSGALALLRRAMSLAPQDAELRATLDRTEKAAERHLLAVERQQKITSATSEVTVLLNRQELQGARLRLRAAREQYGRQKAFDELEERLVDLVQVAQTRSADEHLGRARGAAARADWNGALHQAELALTLAPGHPEAETLRAQARDQLEAQVNQEQRRRSLDEARLDIERLMAAGELARAGQRLQGAIDTLGRDPEFEKLATAIDQSKKDRDFKRRFEWRERRAKEAEGLIQEATRLALGGDFAAAVKHLERARELDPTHPEVDQKLETHRVALERQQLEQAKADALDRTLTEIRGHLDALRLDDATKALAALGGGLRGDPRYDRLVERLSGLREAEAAAGTLPTPGNLPTLTQASRAAVRQHQRAVAGAYSWRQALAYPIRGGVPTALALAAALASGHAAAHGLGFPDLTLLAVAVLVLPGLVRATLDDKNQAPTPAGLWRGAATLIDAFPATLVLSLAAAPALLWVVLRRVHGLFELGPVGFLALSALLWAGAWWACGALGVSCAFGLRYAFAPHKLALPGPTLLAVSALAFTLVAASALLLVAVEPVMGIPLAALTEAFGLLLLGHLIGVMVRSRRLEWASSYGS